MQDSSRPAIGHPYSYPNQAPAPAASGYPAPPPGTAYPYPYPYPNPYPAPSPPNPRATFLRLLLTFLIAGGIILGALFLISVLVLQPRLPTFYLNSLSLSNFNASDNQVSGNWNLQFQVTNPNKKLSVSYHDLFFSIFYDAEFLTQTRIPPFGQGTKDQMVLNATLSVTGTYVERWATDAINKERARGSVVFGVKASAWVGYKYGGWKGRRRMLRVWCNNVAVGVSSSSTSGKFVGGGKQCSVR